MFHRTKKKDKSAFCLGIEDIFPLRGTEDVIVVGQVRGTVTSNTMAQVTSPGRDENTLTLVNITSIEAGGKQVQSISDAPAALRVEGGKKAALHKGAVIFTWDQPEKIVYAAYLTALSRIFLPDQELLVSDHDLEQMTVTDIAEVLRLFGFARAHAEKNKEKSDYENADEQIQINRLGNGLVKKILSVKEMYCLYSKDTGEPMMFSRTIQQETGYYCTPPEIQITTKARAEAEKSALPEDSPGEWKRIENSSGGDGIKNFLGNAFYLNGSQAVRVVSNHTIITAEELVAPPQYDGIPEIQIPVTNPRVMRWLLLINQQQSPEDEDAKIIYTVHFGFLSMACREAKFLVPVQTDPKGSPPDETGKVVLQQDTAVSFPLVPGRDRPAVCVYTDWKRMRSVYDDSWGGLLMTLDQMIDQFDVVVNLTENEKAGCYIDREMYEQMKAFGKDGKSEDES